MKKTTPDEQGVLTLIILALTALLVLLATLSDAHAQYDAFIDPVVQESPYAALVEEQRLPTTYPDGWYYIEAFSCATCPSAKSEIGALVKAGWDITLVDEREEFTKWARPESLPAVIGVSRGQVVQRIHYPFDRWDVSAASKNPQRKEQQYEGPEDVVPAFSQHMMYVPVGGTPYYVNGMNTPFQHLLEHGYDPVILRNTPTSYYNLLHGDAHEGRGKRMSAVRPTLQQYLQSQQTTALPSRLPASNQQYVQSSQFAAPNWQAQGYAFCPTGAG